MNQENRLWKWVVVLGLVALAILAVIPPADKLKPGIDLAGGTSLIYEIDMTGLDRDERVDLADRVMNILKARVDPNSQFNLVWRPIGNNRLEIQMPRPPEEARERRQRYEQAREKIRDLNVSRSEIEQALLQTGVEREEALTALVRGVDGRAERLHAVAAAWDAYSAARGTTDIAQQVETEEAYQAALEAVEATTLPVGRVTDVLALGKGSERERELEQLKKQHPAYVAAIDETVAAYDRWADKRGSLEDAADLKRLLRGAGVLEFRILAERDAANPAMLRDPNDASYNEPVAKYTDQLAKRGPRPKAGDQYAWFEIEDLVKFTDAKDLNQAKAQIEMASEVIAPYAGKYYVLAYVDDGSQRYGLTKTSAKKWELKRAMPSRDPASGRPTVQFQLDPRGGVQFAEVTRRNIGRQLAIFLDGVATSHARIQSQISEHGVITGNFTQERVMEIVRKLEAGSLPARLKEVPLQEKYIGPALGAMNRDRALKAAMYGFIAVAAYMILYYMYLGVLADIALTLNVLFVLAIMAAMEATFTLPGVAGVALTIGMAVDANVLINERIREELRRGVGLKKAIKLGYDKALAAIVDSNLTTLLSCVILGYVGSEEIKGFAMTLGFGVIISMFTALFVTHLILDTLVDRNLVKKLPMLGLIPPTKIDWFALRKPFWTVSLIVLVLGVGFFTVQAARTPAAVFDIELMGGSSVQVELADGVDMDRDAVLAAVTGKGKGGDEKSAADWLRDAADRLAAAKVEPVPGASGEYLVTAEGLSPADVNTMLLTTFERSLARGGFSAEGESARVRTQRLEADEEGDGEAAASGASVDLEGFKAGLASAAEYVRAAADRVADARVLAVAETSEALAGTRTFEIVTVESNKEILRLAILGAMGDRLKVERRIDAVLVTDAERAPDGLFPVREEDRFLGDVLGIEAPIDIQTFKGGVVFVFDQLDPPQTLADLERRFREMRLQPQFEEHAAREEKIFGLTEAGQTRDGAPLFNKIAVVVGDEELMFSDDPAAWEDSLAKPELVRAQEALAMEKSMSKVVQFAPQMARGTQQQAFIAIVLAMIGIILYLWFRFGTMQYGLAAIVALVFDVGVVLGVMAIGELLEIGNLKMDLTMIAAILTVVGYSVNDKIVVFDRVRENLGKLKQITVPVINNSINGTLSRTVLTGGTVLMTMILMYIFGGAGVRGFCLVMIVGVTIGTFSSIGIAAPLLYSRRLTHDVVYCLAGAVAILMTYAMADSAGPVIGVAVVVAIIVGLLLTIERRTEAGQPAAPVAV